MSLKLSNRLTAKQREILQKLDYYGHYDLTQDEAAQLIDELYEEQRLERIQREEHYEDYYRFEGGMLNES